MRHREMVVEYLTTTDNPAMAAASIKAFAHPFLDDRQFAKGSLRIRPPHFQFPAVQEDMNRNRSRGFKR